jgi:hypothetical protein
MAINSRRWNDYLILFLAIIIFGVIYFYLYPEVSSHFTRTLKVESTNLIVQGSYYPLALDGVDSVYLQSGKLVVQGFDMSRFQVSGHREITRTLPEQDNRFHILDTSWTLIDSVKTIGDISIRTFYNRDWGKQFTIQFPYHNEYPSWKAYVNHGDNVLIVLASGNWKQGEKVYFGYIEVINRTNK